MFALTGNGAHQHKKSNNQPCQAETIKKNAAGCHPLGIQLEGSQWVGAIAHSGQNATDGAKDFCSFFHQL